MSLRAKVLGYLVLLHAALAVVSLYAVRQHRPLLLALEALFLLSLGLGWLLVRALFVPLDLVKTGAELLDERDFGSSFHEVGQPEMDALVRVYNRMAAGLREERLKAEEQQWFLERVLAASPGGVVTLDLDGKVALANPSAAALLGVPVEEVAGRPIGALASPLAAPLSALPVGGSEVLALAGGRRVKATRAQFYDRGFPRSFYVLEELTEELRASERAAYGKLIRMMSHEINNSVGSVASLLDSFRAYTGQLGAEDRADFTAALGVAVARLDHLRAFMSGFAEVVRLPPPEPRPCDVKGLVDEILVLLRPQLEARRIACRWTAADPLPPIALDRNQFEQVLVNVLANAMEAIGEDGTIDVALARDRGRGRPTLSIRDSGPGIPPEVQPLLFTPFFSTKRDGRGLGLTLVREVLAQHRFAARLENHPEGGAELRIVF